MFSQCLGCFHWIAGWIGLFAFLSYVLPILAIAVLPVPDLKKKYGATWALVTGSSSGIGKSLARRLAQQGLNVVVCGMTKDALLAPAVKELQKEFPEREFRTVASTLAPGLPYMDAIAKATDDIDVQLVFNNAGYIVTDFFEVSSLDAQLGNLECNAVAAVKITHHFARRLVTNKQRGAIVFTSSAAAAIPSPFTSMYGATKAFVSQFAACLSVELKPCGIDVCSVHPSPVASNFYDKTHQMDAMDFAKTFAVGPEELPDEIIKSIGRCHWRDIGGFAIVVRLAMMAVSYNAVVTLFAMLGHLSPDFQVRARACYAHPRASAWDLARKIPSHCSISDCSKVAGVERAKSIYQSHASSAAAGATHLCPHPLARARTNSPITLCHLAPCRNTRRGARPTQWRRRRSKPIANSALESAAGTLLLFAVYSLQVSSALDYAYLRQLARLATARCTSLSLVHL